MQKIKLLLGVLILSSVVLAEIHLPKSFTTDFIQTITNTKGKVISYNGKVHFTDKKFFKWSYLEPTKKEVCTDANELLVVDHDLEQVSMFYIRQGLDIAKVLAQAKHYKERIYLAEFDGIKYTIELSKTSQLQSIAYFDNLENKVQILFKHMHYTNTRLKKEALQCNYPVDYDIIRG